MKNKSVSELVAMEMDALLNSAEHRSLFNTYKLAEDDDNDARKKKMKEEEDSKAKAKKDEDKSSADDMNDADSAGAHKTPSIESLYNVSPAKDHVSDSKKNELDSCDADDNDDEDNSDADDNDDEDNSDAQDQALDVALASLLNASAALDSVGFEKSASLSLSIAGFVAEAKAKKKDKKKGKGKGKSRRTISRLDC